MTSSDQSNGGRTPILHDEDNIEDPYTVEEHVIVVEGDTGRPEVFIETRPESMDPTGNVELLRDSDALNLYEQLGEYLESEGYDV